MWLGGSGRPSGRTTSGTPACRFGPIRGWYPPRIRSDSCPEAGRYPRACVRDTVRRAGGVAAGPRSAFDGPGRLLPTRVRPGISRTAGGRGDETPRGMRGRFAPRPAGPDTKPVLRGLKIRARVIPPAPPAYPTERMPGLGKSPWTRGARAGSDLGGDRVKTERPRDRRMRRRMRDGSREGRTRKCLVSPHRNGRMGRSRKPDHLIPGRLLWHRVARYHNPSKAVATGYRPSSESLSEIQSETISVRSPIGIGKFGPSENVRELPGIG